jgi:CRISPR-associated protein Csx3
MAFYMVSLSGDTLRGKFGESADNDKIVAELDGKLMEMIESGEIQPTPNAVKFDGPASLQVVSVLTHRLGHIVGALAFRDPKMFVEDPVNGTDFIVAPGTPYEKTVKCRGKMVKNPKTGVEAFVPDPVFVVTVSHSPNYTVGQVLA